MSNFREMTKGSPDWHEQYNADVGRLYSEVETVKSDGSVNKYSYVKNANIHILTGKGEIMRFLPSDSWKHGDQITVNGEIMDPKTLDGQPLPANAFVSGIWTIAIKEGSTLEILVSSNAAVNACMEELKKYALLEHRHQTGDITGLLEALTDLRRASDVSDDKLRMQIEDVAGRIEAVWNSLSQDIKENPFAIAFPNLDGVIVESGVWNEALQRLEC